MSKSTRTPAGGSNPSRRYSQPAFGGPQSSDRGRRISEAAPNARGGDPLPPGSGSLAGGQYDERQAGGGDKGGARKARGGKVSRSSDL